MAFTKRKPARFRIEQRSLRPNDRLVGAINHRDLQDGVQMTCRANMGSEIGLTISTADYMQPTPNIPMPIQLQCI
jgi:hypothetical protein